MIFIIRSNPYVGLLKSTYLFSFIKKNEGKDWSSACESKGLFIYFNYLKSLPAFVAGPTV